jgi:hypothetical protein
MPTITWISSSFSNEPTKECVNWEFLLFRWFQADIKEISCPLLWWSKHETIFPTMGLLVWQKMVG